MSSREYFRRDRSEGVSPPDLSKVCSYAEHIVRARGKRTQFTSVSLAPSRIRDFGDTLYRLKQAEVLRDRHDIVEHEALLANLADAIRASDRADRARAVQALRYARLRREGLVSWRFNCMGIAPKDLINWATPRVNAYFVRV